MVDLIIQDEVNIEFKNLPLSVRQALVAKFKYEIPHARFHPSYKLGRWDGLVSLFGMGGNCFLNQLDAILPILEEHEVVIDNIIDKRKPATIDFPKVNENYWADQGKCWPEKHVAAGELILLRDYQIDLINAMLENQQCLIESCTGSGKTMICATLVHCCESLGRTLTIVPNKSLVVQTLDDYVNVGLDVGVYYGDSKQLGHKHTICTWQSLNAIKKQTIKDPSNCVVTLDDFLRDIKTVIIDEVHGLKLNVLRDLMIKQLINAPIRWGMTGTIPKNEYEKAILLTSIGPVVHTVKAHELQERGVLSNCNVNVMQYIDIKRFANFHQELTWLHTDPKRLKHVSEAIDRISKSGNTLVLVNRLDCGQLLKEFLGNNAVFLSGKDKTHARKAEYDSIKFEDNKVIIATYQIASTGIDIVRLFNLVLFEPGKSFIRVIQSIGRGLRKGGDKDHVEIYDIASTCDYSRRHLSERKKFYKEAKYKFNLTKIDWT